MRDPARAGVVAAGAYPFIGGSLALVGWALDIRRLTSWDGGLTMKANTALCAAFAGLAMMLLVPGPGARNGVRLLAALVAGIGGLTLLEHLTGVNFGIDTLLFDEPAGATATVAPGRMGPPASTSFTIIGACLLLCTDGRRARRVASGLALAPLLISALGIIGYLFGASQLYLIAQLTGIAMQTATMIAVLGLGLVLALPEQGLLAALRRQDPGGVMFRNLLAPIVAVSLGLGALRIYGEHRGLYDAAFGTAARTLIEITLLLGIVWWTAERVSGQAAVARRAEDALRDADRRKDEFLATLAHELRNPLAPLRTGADLIARKPGNTEAVTRTVAVMERQLEQMVHLVDDLLDVSRISRGNIELRRQRIDVATIVDEAIETSRPVIDGFGHHLIVERSSEALVVDGDPTRLTQVLANLLNNAAKYTEPGGRIEVRIARDGDRVAVRVRDTGAGIPDDVRPRLFDMFSRSAQPLERLRGGLGVGLALVKRLVEMHGGSVEVKSPPGGAGNIGNGNGNGAAGGDPRGSEFIVRLPLAAAQADDAAAIAAVPSPPAPATNGTAHRERARLRVLIADDNDDAVDMLAMLVDELGHETRTAQDGVEALAAGAAFRPDVAFLDVGMPKLNGYEVGQRMRAEPWGKDMMLVALTGWGQPDDRRRSTEAGFDRHLVKPATLEMIESVLTASARRD